MRARQIIKITAVPAAAVPRAVVPVAVVPAAAVLRAAAVPVEVVLPAAAVPVEADQRAEEVLSSLLTLEAETAGNPAAVPAEENPVEDLPIRVLLSRAQNRKSGVREPYSAFIFKKS